ncbi:hypothetical protein JW887_06605 [Candidatus Dojkabacteria bacterium]|nr:hypothetical protein [Candidatus Dojkabacteria bacterium]
MKFLIKETGYKVLTALDIGGLDPGNVPQVLSDLTNTIKTVFSTAYAFAGVVTVGFMIIGGYKMIMSSGDSQKLDEGRNTLVNALIGMVVVVISGLLFNFVGDKLGIGSVISAFNLPFL